jgi:hypothetical protein
MVSEMAWVWIRVGLKREPQSRLGDQMPLGERPKSLAKKSMFPKKEGCRSAITKRHHIFLENS